MGNKNAEYTTIPEIQNKLASLGCAATRSVLMRFYKTDKGQYAEGDCFRGIRVPQLRMLLLKTCLELHDIEKVLESHWHEDRLFALLFMVNLYNKGGNEEKKTVFDCYMKNVRHINNWDLVDLSAPYIPGPYLFTTSRDILYRMADSENIWSRRIALVATLFFIRNNEFNDTLALAEMYINDKEDLIWKATGWMLREIGKRDQGVLEGFLSKWYSQMPRTMLRYAIEKFPEVRRLAYLQGDV